MILLNTCLSLLLSTAILVDSQKLQCNDDSHCGNNKICDNTRKCINPCNSIVCGTNARCHLSKKKPECFCLANTHGDPKVSCQAVQGCTRHSDCGNNGLCALGRCEQKTVVRGAGSCKSAKCGHGALCEMKNGRPECFCPSNTEGNPHMQCQHKQGCRDHSQCANNKRCEKGKCVDPCELINCGHGAICQTSGRHPMCICPSNTQGDPLVNCQPKSECAGDANCGANKVCRSGSCVNPCDWAKCGEGATCQVFHRRPLCMCPDNTQVQEQVQCRPTHGASSVCQFPFIYKGTTFTACTTESDPEGKPWCSTKTDRQKNHQKGNWQHCTDFATCKFPFIHKNVRYSECTTVDAPDGKPWCSTKTDSRSNHQKGNFKHCTNSGTSSDFATCKFPFIYKNVRYSDCTTVDASDGKPWCSTKTDSRSNHQEGNFKHCTNSGTSSDNELKQTPTNIGDRNVMVTPATNNQAVLQFTQTPIKSQGQESTRDAGCYSLPDPGECRGAFPRFYYNQQTDQCDCFLFGGCDEERVKFTWLSLKECLRTCVPTNKAKGPGCERVTLEEVHRFLENQ